eukprot:6190949-Pleurochrysis_carterae.AAC.1
MAEVTDGRSVVGKGGRHPALRGLLQRRASACLRRTRPVVASAIAPRGSATRLAPPPPSFGD